MYVKYTKYKIFKYYIYFRLVKTFEWMQEAKNDIYELT